ncbi:hypothetical protein [Streptomyces sp. NPDC046870]|uniref:hypothetical protein n=1 Tax=Streptomyces sp. NPDC046870 TaxID=3155135 RepID=UPI0034570846
MEELEPLTTLWVCATTVMGQPSAGRFLRIIPSPPDRKLKRESGVGINQTVAEPVPKATSSWFAGVDFTITRAHREAAGPHQKVLLSASLATTPLDPSRGRPSTKGQPGRRQPLSPVPVRHHALTGR